MRCSFRNMLHHFPKPDDAPEEEQEVARKVVEAKLMDGGVFLKFGRSGAPHYRYVWCSEDLQKLFWGELKKNKKIVGGEINVEKIQKLVRGPQTGVQEEY